MTINGSTVPTFDRMLLFYRDTIARHCRGKNTTTIRNGYLATYVPIIDDDDDDDDDTSDGTDFGASVSDLFERDKRVAPFRYWHDIVSTAINYFLKMKRIAFIFGLVWFNTLVRESMKNQLRCSLDRNSPIRFIKMIERASNVVGWFVKTRKKLQLTAL